MTISRIYKLHCHLKSYFNCGYQLTFGLYYHHVISYWGFDADVDESCLLQPSFRHAPHFLFLDNLKLPHASSEWLDSIGKQRLVCICGVLRPWFCQKDLVFLSSSSTCHVLLSILDGNLRRVQLCMRARLPSNFATWCLQWVLGNIAWTLWLILLSVGSIEPCACSHFHWRLPACSSMHSEFFLLLRNRLILWVNALLISFDASLRTLVRLQVESCKSLLTSLQGVLVGRRTTCCYCQEKQWQTSCQLVPWCLGCTS